MGVNDSKQSIWHDDVIKWKHFHRSPVNYPHKGQWRGALMFSLICAWINGWVNNGDAGDLRRHGSHYDVIIMITGQYFTVVPVTSHPLLGAQSLPEPAIAYYPLISVKQTSALEYVTQLIFFVCLNVLQPVVLANNIASWIEYLNFNEYHILQVRAIGISFPQTCSLIQMTSHLAGTLY